MLKKIILSVLSGVILTATPSFATQTFNCTQSAAILVLDTIAQTQPGLLNKTLHPVCKYFSDKMLGEKASHYGTTLRFEGLKGRDFVDEFMIKSYPDNKKYQKEIPYVNVRQITFSSLNQYNYLDTSNEIRPFADEYFSEYMGNLYDALSGHLQLEVVLYGMLSEPYVYKNLSRLQRIKSLNIDVWDESGKICFGNEIESITVRAGDSSGEAMTSITRVGPGTKHFTLLYGISFDHGEGINLSAAIDLESLYIESLNCPLTIPQKSFKSLTIKELWGKAPNPLDVIGNSQVDRLEISLIISSLTNLEEILNHLSQICLKDLTFTVLMRGKDYEDYGNNNYFTSDVFDTRIKPLFTAESSHNEHILFANFYDREHPFPEYSTEGSVRAHLHQIVLDGQERSFLIYQTLSSVITNIQVTMNFYNKLSYILANLKNGKWDSISKRVICQWKYG